MHSIRLSAVVFVAISTLVLTTRPALGTIVSDALEIDLVDPAKPIDGLADKIACNKGIPEAATEAASATPCLALTILTPAGSTFLDSSGTIGLTEEKGGPFSGLSDLVGVQVTGLVNNKGNPIKPRPVTYQLTISLLSDAESGLKGAPFASIAEDGSTKGFPADAKGFVEVTKLLTDLLGAIEVRDLDPHNLSGVREVHIFVRSKDVLAEPASLVLIAVGVGAGALARRWRRRDPRRGPD
jgi:hypothetical protein